jgi:tripartite-type tricarboxylate transporter receptor subunit TctC
MKSKVVFLLVAAILIVTLLAGCTPAATSTTTTASTTKPATTTTATTAATTTTAPPTTTTTPTPTGPSAAEFYKGKTISILVPSAPGGTFDLISRGMAPYLAKYTGASTQIVNSANIEAQNKLAASKADGLTVILAGHGAKEITGQMFKQQGVSYDWTKFVVLGKIADSSSAIVVDKKLGWTKSTDPVGKDFLMGCSTPFFEPLFAEALGWDKMKLIPGMSGSERALALRRGEIQGTSAGAAQVSQNTDLMQPLVVTVKDDKGFKGIPVVADVAVKGKEKFGQWANAWDKIMYWSATTPGTPLDRSAYLENALAQTYKDAAFVADMAKLNIDIAPEFLNAKTLSTMLNTLAAMSPADISEMQTVIEVKYLKK